MRLRHALIFLFMALTAVPLTVFWAWPHSLVLQNEFDDARNSHLLLARNIGVTLRRYHQDVLSVFNLITANLMKERQIERQQDLLLNLSFRHICIVEETTGKVIEAAGPDALLCPKTIPEKRMDLFSRMARENRVTFSQVLEGPDGSPVMYLVRRIGRLLAVGTLDTDYFVRLGEMTSFGGRSHTAIIDHRGNVLAHPREDWIATRRNLAEVSVVGRMINGETGVQTFYSPALESDMIAGFAIVPDVGWGVMIPQPIVELHERARQAQTFAITVFLFGILIALICAWVVSILFARPLEQISRAADKVVHGDEAEEIAELKSKVVPIEFRRVQSSYNAMIRRQRDNMISINKLAYEDKVTGLPNRIMFRKYVIEKLRELKATGRGGLMLFIDLDGFKAVNDSHGHDLGDELLHCFSIRLHALLNHIGPVLDGNDETCSPPALLARGYLLARLGGDEFAAFIPGTECESDAESIAKTLLRGLCEPFLLGQQETTISASIGIARVPIDGNDYTTLIRHADMAMYEAKRAGKNTFRLYDCMIQTVLDQAGRVRRELPQALELDQFELHFQPRFDASSHQVRCMEALIRWNHPSDGQRLPDEFLPMIEGTDGVISIDHWVLRNALGQLAVWLPDYPELAISINMSAQQLTDRDLANNIIDLVREADVDPTRIELEVTEHAVLNNERTAREVIQRLHQFGLKIAIDDFGQGYSNFARFAQLPVDVIKIDRSLTSKLTVDQRMPKIVGSLVAMAKGLNCMTVAEGIETQEEVSILSQIGCTEFQGYLFSKPLDARNAAVWLADASVRACQTVGDGPAA
ncbi:MAG: putative bifunctional diguanylate cyclase/phosphodiesterase [Geminicoccaceae bacterium]